MRHGAGASNRVRTARNAGFPRRAARGEGGSKGPRRALRRPAGGGERPPRKCVVTHVAVRGPRGPLEPCGALRRGPLGSCGIAAVRREALGLANFPSAPRAPGIGLVSI